MIEMFQNYVDQWEFQIKAKNHHVLVISYNGYESKKSCINAINSLLTNLGVEKITRNLMIKSIKEIKRRKNV